jgi:acyl transferase domain-containing protein
VVPPGHTLEDLDADGVVLETLRRDQGGPERLIEVLAAAFIHGCPSPGPACCPAGTWTCPAYAFQHGRYWLDEPARSVKPDGLGLAAAGHPLLGCGGGVGAGRQGHVHRTPVAVLPSLAGRPRRPRHRYRPRHRATELEFPAVSAVPARNDRNAVAGADGAGVRVVGESDV